MGVMLARDLLKLPPEALWDACNNITQLEFDDGVFDVTPRLIPMSRYMWVYQELYPEVPLNSNQMLTSVYIRPDSCQKILNVGYWACYYAVGEKLGKEAVKFREEMSRIGLERLNLLYNDSTIYCSEHVRGCDAGDYLDLINNESLAAIRNSIKTDPKLTPRKLIRLIDEAKKILLNDPTLDNNPAAIAVRCGSMKIDQLIQSVIGRGYGSDVDSVIFKNAVRPAYIDGIDKLEYVLIDACSASRAIFYQKKPTQESEYLNRRLRMNSAYLKNIHYEFCGTEKYHECIIATERILQDYAGKYYLNEDSNLVPIRKTDKHLIGKKIKRLSNFSCIHPDRYGVCSTCYGDIALSVPDETNLGMTSTTTVLSVLVQLLLSAKHIILSSVGDAGELADSEAHKWMHVDSTNPLESSVFLKEVVAKDKLQITIKADEAKMMQDVTDIENFDDVSAARMTTINTLLITSPITSEDDFLDEFSLINIGTREAPYSLSLDALKYIVEKGYEVDKHGNYMVSMEDWDSSKPFLDIPVTQQSIPLYISSIDQFITTGPVITHYDRLGANSNQGKSDEEIKREQVESFLKARKGKAKRKSTDMPALYHYGNNPMAATTRLHEIISQKMQVNITHLEAMVLALTAESPEDRDYRLPLNRNEAQIITYSQAMRFRSISALLAYEEQSNALYDAATLLVKHRASHPYDELFEHLT